MDLTGFHPDILRIRTAFVNAYLIRNGSNSVLVDSGLQRSGKLVLNAIEDAGLSRNDIRLIILTHLHYDHSRGAAALRAATGADLLVHRLHEAGLKKGYCRLPKGTNLPIEAWVTMGRTFMPWLSWFPAAEPGIVTGDRYELQHLNIDATVLHTPGHTNGSLTVILEGKHALVGDTLIGSRRTVYPTFADDKGLLMQSWEGLLEMKVEYLYPGHGAPFRAERLLAEYSNRKRKI